MLQIGKRADHGFDEPLGLLNDCHRRIEHFLGVLIAVSQRAAGRSLDERERAAATSALEYFATAAPRHTADEEESLFPRLLASGDRDVTTLMERLGDDHDRADEHHRGVDRLMRRWLDARRLSDTEHRELVNRLASLKDMYDAHIAAEDGQLFPAAARILPADDLRAIGREMAARRVTPSPRRDAGQ
jgi:hemerythrin-like domain-containing protein